jgi:antirestriction protein ArdC
MRQIRLPIDETGHCYSTEQRLLRPLSDSSDDCEHHQNELQAEIAIGPTFSLKKGDFD